jgi:hypothetical protein
MIDYNEYEIDADGTCVLKGLSAAETAEFQLLVQTVLVDETAEESDILRWLEFYEKHYAAIRAFSHSIVSQH